MKTILVPVDFSDVTSDVVRVACQMARTTRSRLVLLHVIEKPTAFEMYGVGSPMILESLIAAEQIAARRLRELALRCHRKVKPVRTIQRTGKPVPTILAKAAELKPAWLMLGSHGHGAVYDLAVGSTTLGVLRRANCAVIVVPTTPRRSGPRHAAPGKK